MAVSLGYQNVYRYPQGYPEWAAKGLPAASLINDPAAAAPARAAGPPTGLALLWTLLGVLIGGMALNLTPCVYPLIPITVSYFGGRSGKSHGQLIAHGFCYITGLAVTNSTLGVIAALTGGLMGAMLQNTWVLVGVAVVLLAFASSLFGFWELRLPGGFTRAASKSYAGYFGSLFMGLTLGIIAAPCIGPFVLGLLTWVAGVGRPWFGFVVFFSLSVGLGLPLFILALFSGRLEKLPRSGEWMIWIRRLMGWVLVGMAAYFIRPLLPKTVSVILYSAIALTAGVHLAWIDKSRASFKAFKWIKNGVGLAAIVFAVFLIGSWLMRGPGVVWQPYEAGLLNQAGRERRPVIMDFYATWCAPCREFDEITFHDPQVVEGAKRFVMVKVDLTRGDNPLYRQLVKDYEVKGVPTIVFIDASGGERRDMRLVDFMKPADFLKHLDKIQ